MFEIKSHFRYIHSDPYDITLRMVCNCKYCKYRRLYSRDAGKIVVKSWKKAFGEITFIIQILKLHMDFRGLCVIQNAFIGNRVMRLDLSAIRKTDNSVFGFW